MEPTSFLDLAPSLSAVPLGALLSLWLVRVHPLQLVLHFCIFLVGAGVWWGDLGCHGATAARAIRRARARRNRKQGIPRRRRVLRNRRTNARKTKPRQQGGILTIAIHAALRTRVRQSDV